MYLDEGEACEQRSEQQRWRKEKTSKNHARKKNGEKRKEKCKVEQGTCYSNTLVSLWMKAVKSVTPRNGFDLMDRLHQDAILFELEFYSPEIC